MTVGISFTSPGLPIPDVLLVARPIFLSEAPTLPHNTKFQPGHKVKYELSRMFPLRLVKISVHDVEKQQLRFKLASGRTFYLQLCPETYRRDYLFESWVKIIQLLWPSSNKKSGMKEKAIKSSRIRSSPPSRPKTPSKCPTESTTAESKQTITKSLLGKKHKKKTSKAKSPVSRGKAQDPAAPPKTEQEAKPVCPLPPQAKEVTEVSKKMPAERNPSCRSPTGEKGRHEYSYSTSRRSIKPSHPSSRSGQRGATQKSSKLISFIRFCARGSPKKKTQGVIFQSKEKKQSAKEGEDV